MEIEDSLPKYDMWIDAKLLSHPSMKGKIPSNFVAEFNTLSENP